MRTAAGQSREIHIKMQGHFEDADFPLSSPYEDLVKEFLELDGYFVRQGFKYGKKRNELDILAVKLKPKQVLVAEVKATSPSKEMFSELAKKLRSKELASSVRREVGVFPTKRVIFYWLSSAETKRVERNQHKRIQEWLRIAGPRIELRPLQDVAKRLYDEAVKDRRTFYLPHQPVATLLQLLYPFRKGTR